MLGNDTDVDGDALTAVLVDRPAHGTLTLNADGSFTYTPDANYNGPDCFTYKANDGTADCNVATVSITVSAGQRRAGGRRTTRYTTERGHAADGRRAGVLGNDTDVDGDTLTATLVDRPGQRHADAQRRRLVHLHAGRQLQRHRQLHLQGQRRHRRQQRRHRVAHRQPRSTTPRWPSTTPIRTDEDTRHGRRAGRAGQRHRRRRRHPHRGARRPARRTARCAQRRRRRSRYTPTADFNGPDSFTYKANDGTADCNVATVTLTVNAVNDAPGGHACPASNDLPVDEGTNHIYSYSSLGRRHG